MKRASGTGLSMRAHGSAQNASRDNWPWKSAMQVAVQFELSSMPVGMPCQKDIGSPRTLDVYTGPAQMRGSGKPVRSGADHGDVGVRGGTVSVHRCVPRGRGARRSCVDRPEVRHSRARWSFEFLIASVNSERRTCSRRSRFGITQ